jgi:hypothetical protein
MAPGVQSSTHQQWEQMMALRSFMDSAGNEWQAFDVVPRSNERRNYERRLSDDRATTTAADRREGDRRVTVGGRTSMVVGQGWLCFQRGTDRRRLSPIPDDWQRLSDAELDALCRTARPVRSLTLGAAQAFRRNA